MSAASALVWDRLDIVSLACTLVAAALAWWAVAAARRSRAPKGLQPDRMGWATTLRMHRLPRCHLINRPISAALVPPCNPRSNFAMELTGLDEGMENIFISVVLFYPCLLAPEPLRAGLRAALDVMPEFAARIDRSCVRHRFIGADGAVFLVKMVSDEALPEDLRFPASGADGRCPEMRQVDWIALGLVPQIERYVTQSTAADPLLYLQVCTSTRVLRVGANIYWGV